MNISEASDRENVRVVEEALNKAVEHLPLLYDVLRKHKVTPGGSVMTLLVAAKALCDALETPGSDWAQVAKEVGHMSRFRPVREVTETLRQFLKKDVVGDPARQPRSQQD